MGRKGQIAWNKGKSSWNKGIPITASQRANLREKNLGRKRGPNSKETNEKIREALKGRVIGPHGPCKEETKRRIGEANKGKKRSPETIEKLRIIARARDPEINKRISTTVTGSKHTPETRLKIAEGSRNHSPESRARQSASMRAAHKANPNWAEKCRQVAIKRVQQRLVPFKDTSIELVIQRELAKRGIPFITQAKISGFVVDLYLPEHEIIIECDGCYYHGCRQCGKGNLPHAAKRWLKDEQRDTKIYQSGYDLFRFWEHDIVKSPGDCVNRLCL